VIEQGNFKMPTAFTPNGDGKNDRFFPVLSPNSTSKVTSFRVYNRWGQLLYDNPVTGWDGGFGGTPQATDTYVYFVTVESPDPNDASKRTQKSVEGSFQLFR
jgi:gliding motility-associated-like protein